MSTVMVRLACTRGKDTFGLTLQARNTKHALVLAKRLLDGSGYSVHPLTNKA